MLLSSSMAKEVLPNREDGDALTMYERARSRVTGGRLMSSGLKAAGVGLFAAAALLTADTTFALTTAAGSLLLAGTGGAILAGGAIAYGALKLIEGIGNRLRGAL